MLLKKKRVVTMTERTSRILYCLAMEALILNNLNGQNDKEELERVDELQAEAEQLYEEEYGKKFVYKPSPPKKRKRRKNNEM